MKVGRAPRGAAPPAEAGVRPIRNVVDATATYASEHAKANLT